MNFLAACFQKREPSCEIGAYVATIFRKVLYRKWPLLALSFLAIKQYPGYCPCQN